MQAAMTSSASKPGSLLGGGALKPQELLPACINIIGTFEPTKTTVDSHHADFCKRHKARAPPRPPAAARSAPRPRLRAARARAQLRHRR
jgi:hypothetical protein